MIRNQRNIYKDFIINCNMKYFISNRGNINGRKESKENSPKYVLAAIKNGFHCVVDVIFVENVLYFGNSNHLYIIDLDFIITNNEYLWLRCSDYATVNYLLQIKNVKLSKIQFGKIPSADLVWMDTCPVVSSSRRAISPMASVTLLIATCKGTEIFSK